MILSTKDALLVSAKLIELDMRDIHKTQADAPVFFGMGQALMRLFQVIKGMTFEQVMQVRAYDMLLWIRDEKVPGLKDGYTVSDCITLLKQG